jgi:hypothetical protein
MPGEGLACSDIWPWFKVEAAFLGESDVTNAKVEVLHEMQPQHPLQTDRRSACQLLSRTRNDGA